jgi:hypothetical protein
VARRPGASLAGNAQALAADAGRFRRLPTPGEASSDEAEAARRRQRMMRALTGGVDRGRTSPDEEDPA